MDCKITCFERVLHYVKPLPKEKINDAIEIALEYTFRDFLDFLVENKCCTEMAIETLHDGIVMWENLVDTYWEEDPDKLQALYDKVGLTKEVIEKYVKDKEKMEQLYKLMYDCLVSGGLLVDDISLEDDGLKLFVDDEKYKVCIIKETDLIGQRRKNHV